MQDRTRTRGPWLRRLRDRTVTAAEGLGVPGKWRRFRTDDARLNGREARPSLRLNFRARAREALGFDQSVSDGASTIGTDADAHRVTDPSEADQVMWGQVSADDGFRIMAVDVPSSRPWSPGEAPFFVSVSSPVEEDIASRWERLRVGGTVLHPLSPAAWAPLHGMVRDRFGITWILAVDETKSSVDEHDRGVFLAGGRGQTSALPCRR